jgi:hypothetical protein
VVFSALPSSAPSTAGWMYINSTGQVLVVV